MFIINFTSSFEISSGPSSSSWSSTTDSSTCEDDAIAILYKTMLTGNK